MRGSGRPATCYFFRDDLFFSRAEQQVAWTDFSQACEKTQVAALPARPGSGRHATCFLFCRLRKKQQVACGPGGRSDRAAPARPAAARRRSPGPTIASPTRPLAWLGRPTRASPARPEAGWGEKKTSRGAGQSALRNKKQVASRAGRQCEKQSRVAWPVAGAANVRDLIFWAKKQGVLLFGKDPRALATGMRVVLQEYVCSCRNKPLVAWNTRIASGTGVATSMPVWLLQRWLRTVCAAAGMRV